MNRGQRRSIGDYQKVAAWHAFAVQGSLIISEQNPARTTLMA